MLEPILFIRYDELLGFFFRTVIHYYLTDINNHFRLHMMDDRFDNIVWAKDESENDVILAFFDAKPREIREFAYSVDMSLENALVIQPNDYSGSLEGPLYKAINVFRGLLSRDYPSIYRLLESDLSVFAKFRNDPLHDPFLKERFYKYSRASSDFAQSLIDGSLTFCNPSTFNDPFDCDCQIITDQGTMNLKDSFRVLALGTRPDDILMWAYYGEDHKGIAVEHELRDIIRGLSAAYHGIAIYGEVKYKKARPKYKTYGIPSGSASFVIDLDFLVRCCFTKYRGWKHENEFRILTFASGFAANTITDYMTISNSPSQVFQGMKFVQPTTPLSFPPGTKKLKKDPRKYRLVF